MISRVDREDRKMGREGLDGLIERVRQIAYRLHVYLGVGLLKFYRLPILPISMAQKARTTVYGAANSSVEKQGQV